MDARDRPPRRGQVRASTSPSTTWSASGSGCRSASCSGISADDPADRLHPGHRRAGGRRRAGPPRRRLPGAQDQGGRPGRPRDARGRAGRLRGPIRVDANTGWTPEAARAAAAGARAPGRGAHRAAVPGPPARPAALAPGALRAADRRRRERRDDRGPRRAWSASSPGVNVKLAKCGGIGPARRMLERARELGFRTFLGCMEETLDRDRRLGRGRAARGVGRPRRLPAARRRPGRRASSSAPTSAGSLADAARAWAWPGPTRGSSIARPSPSGRSRPQVSRASGPVHRGCRAVDKSVGNMVEKPLPASGAGPTMSPIAGDRGRPGRGARRARRLDRRRRRAAPARPPARSRAPRERRTCHRCCPPAPPPAHRPRPRPSSGSATSAVASGWPELYDEMCAVATRGLFRGMGHEALAEIGVGFSLFETPRLAALVTRIVDRGAGGAARGAARR